jgi:hypothetical protein
VSPIGPHSAIPISLLLSWTPKIFSDRLIYCIFIIFCLLARLQKQSAFSGARNMLGSEDAKNGSESDLRALFAQVVEANKMAAIPAVAAPKPVLGWCGVFSKNGVVFWDNKTKESVCALVSGWFPASVAVYETQSVKQDECLIHVVFPSEPALLNAISQEHKSVGSLRRCMGYFNCSHAECQIKELVVVSLVWSSLKLRPPVQSLEEQQVLQRAVSKTVQALPGKPKVDRSWMKHAVGSRASAFVYLALHSESDVAAVVALRPN